jgi:hypothetical protein
MVLPQHTTTRFSRPAHMFCLSPCRLQLRKAAWTDEDGNYDEPETDEPSLGSTNATPAPETVAGGGRALGEAEKEAGDSSTAGAGVVQPISQLALRAILSPQFAISPDRVGGSPWLEPHSSVRLPEGRTQDGLSYEPISGQIAPVPATYSGWFGQNAATDY